MNRTVSLTPAQVKLLLKGALQIEREGIGDHWGKAQRDFKESLVKLLRQIAGTP